jgi:hypothetical protein
MKKLLVAFFLFISISVFAEDMQKYLTDTQMMVRQGMYQEALERFVWFHDHALEHNYSMVGVRLSFALAYWKELGKAYPQAMQALIETRDRKTAQILNGAGSFDLFHDVKALNRTLEESDKTVLLFESLDKNNPTLARLCWNVAKEDVIAAKRFDLARKYIVDYIQEFNRVKAMYDLNVSTAKDPRMGGDIYKRTIEDIFVKEILQLINVAVALGDEREASEIQVKALAVIDDPRLGDAFPK